MILFLDARTRTVDFRLIANGRECGRKKIRLASADRLFAYLIDFLSRHRVRLGKGTDFVVVTGPGTFSCVRAAVTIANALAFAESVRLHTLRAADELSPVTTAAILAAADRQSTQRVTPFYGRQPSITFRSNSHA